jgi:hypothetical protein
MLQALCITNGCIRNGLHVADQAFSLLEIEALVDRIERGAGQHQPVTLAGPDAKPRLPPAPAAGTAPVGQQTNDWLLVQTKLQERACTRCEW